MTPRLALSDRCGAPESPTVSNPGDYEVSTVGFEDNLRFLAACVGRELPGTDGFFRVQMAEGELWHFHIRGVQGSDPALYVLPNCDERSCAVGIDECGEGRDEHLSFRAPATRTYLVGVDSRSPSQAVYALTVEHPVCGNDNLEHGETCDDGNVRPGDGCDERCRVELRDGSAEREPNDDYVTANVVGAITAPVTAQGKLAAGCDFDTYAVTVPAGGSLRATMLDVNGLACGAGSPALKMFLLLPDGRTVSREGAPSGTSTCPSIASGAGLVAGTYFVRIAFASDTSSALDYRLLFEVAPP